MGFWLAMCYNFVESFTVLYLVSRSHKFRKNLMVSKGFSGFMLSAIIFAGKPRIAKFFSFFKIGSCRQYNLYWRINSCMCKKVTKWTSLDRFCGIYNAFFEKCSFLKPKVSRLFIFLLLNSCNYIKFKLIFFCVM